MVVEVVPEFLARPDIETGSLNGPASYATGGFVLDLSAVFSSVKFCRLAVLTVGALPVVSYRYELDTPAAGQVRISLHRSRFDRFTIGAVSGQPAGVTVAGAATSVDAAGAHTHASAAHLGHGAVDVANAMLSGTATGTAINDVHVHAASAGAHTHDAVASHQHARAYEFSHDHPGNAASHTQTDIPLAQVAAATNLSTTLWRYLVLGTRL